MTTYLDKKTVLKAVDERLENDSRCFGCKLRIIQGEFDAPQIPIGIDHLGLMKALAAKDAEIARLKKELFFISTSATIRGKSILASFRIIGDLKSRIVELEKLTALQKETIDAQGKALREARPPKRIVPCPIPDRGCPWYAVYEDERGTRHCCMKWRDENDGKGTIHACGEPAQKEPELFICPNAGCKPACQKCTHNYLHEWIKERERDDEAGCAYNGVGGCEAVCIPVKSPVPTSGTGTAPEGATTGLREWVSDSLQRHIRLIEACQNRIDELEERMPPSMAKDIGDLTLRMDNLESRLALEGKAQQEQNAAISKHAEQIYSLESGIRHHNARLHEIEQRQGRDRAELVAQRATNKEMLEKCFSRVIGEIQKGKEAKS